MPAAFDTDAVSPHERFAFYREVVLSALYRMTPEVRQAPEAFRSLLTPRPVANALAVHCRGTPHLVARTQSDIAANLSDCYFIFQQLGPAPAIFRGNGGGESFDVASGDLVLGDADTPFETPEHAGYNHLFWMLPKRLIDPILPGAGALLGHP